MGRRILEYVGGGLTVRYDVRRCIHAAECVAGLPAVFDPRSKPWVSPDGAGVEQVAEVIQRCPTGALSYERRDGAPGEPVPERNVVEPRAGGPLHVRGDLEVVTEQGEAIAAGTRFALCRCGASRDKPFCDGSHVETGFRAAADFPSRLAAGSAPPEGGRLRIVVRAGGPLRCEGPFVVVRAADGEPGFQGERGSLCRCGASNNKPFCDGSHLAIGFDAG